MWIFGHVPTLRFVVVNFFGHIDLVKSHCSISVWFLSAVTNAEYNIILLELVICTGLKNIFYATFHLTTKLPKFNLGFLLPWLINFGDLTSWRKDTESSSEVEPKTLGKFVSAVLTVSGLFTSGLPTSGCEQGACFLLRHWSEWADLEKVKSHWKHFGWSKAWSEKMNVKNTRDMYNRLVRYSDHGDLSDRQMVCYSD